jgi:DNA repair exonuclease SbcCD ATPase subunit
VWIDALKIEGGVLDGFDQRFKPTLNVLIGGRGTGKSSLIELIRFCLGATSSTEAGQQGATEHALGVLGDGRVTVILSDGKHRVEVSRTAQDVEPEASDPFVVPLVFSQSEIETIGLQAQSRLRLIDGFLNPHQRTMAHAARAANIRSTTTEIRSLLAEIDDITEKTAELPKLEAQLETFKAQATAQSQIHKEIESHRKTLAENTASCRSASPVRSNRPRCRSLWRLGRSA